VNKDVQPRMASHRDETQRAKNVTSNMIQKCVQHYFPTG